MKIIILALFIFSSEGVSGQNFTGLWEVRRVFAGEEEKTPVAKWMKIFPDSTYISGNGWLQHSRGTWTYNREGSEFLPLQENGIRDPYGPFTLIVEDDKMVWERMEDGMEVSVYLQKSEELPLAPQDLLTGLWEWVEYSEKGEAQTNILDKKDRVYIHFRWDRIYLERDQQGTQVTGYWHMEGHRSELTLIPEDENLPRNRWKVRFQADRLILTRGGGEPETRIFRRVHEFPQGISPEGTGW